MFLYRDNLCLFLSIFVSSPYLSCFPKFLTYLNIFCCTYVNLYNSVSGHFCAFQLNILRHVLWDTAELFTLTLNILAYMFTISEGRTTASVSELCRDDPFLWVQTRPCMIGFTFYLRWILGMAELFQLFNANLAYFLQLDTEHHRLKWTFCSSPECLLYTVVSVLLDSSNPTILPSL